MEEPKRHWLVELNQQVQLMKIDPEESKSVRESRTFLVNWIQEMAEILNVDLEVIDDRLSEPEGSLNGR